MFKLVIEDDEGNKTVVPIIRDEITIGRKDGNTIRLTERNVSREHARLVRENGGVFMEEVSARYGTRKNGERIDGRTDFDVGDVFTIGDYRLTLQSEAAAEAKSEKKPKKNGAAPAPSTDDFDLVEDDEPPPLPANERKEGTEIIATDPAKMVIVSSNFAGQEFPLARREMVIGRGEECDIIIDHRSVSQKHAKVIRESNSEYKIIDLNSKNGVKVGGEEYRAVHLKRGDIVELGHVKFRFVEPGENYVFTPHAEEESRSKGPNLALFAFIAIVLAALAGVAGFLAMGGDPPQPEEDDPVATAPEKDGSAPVVPDEPEVDDGDIDAKIEKAEGDYLAGRVEKAMGMLELLREEESITPEQVERIDDLMSKTKRERAFVRYYENGKEHFESEQWLDALSEFRQIPDDDELNIYRLVEDARYIDTAVANATEELLATARGDSDDAEQARDDLMELKAMFPNHVAPTEAVAELASAAPVDKPKTPRKPRQPSNPKQDPEPKTIELEPKKDDPPELTPENLELAERMLMDAKRAFGARKFDIAIRKAKTAIDNGCRADCYRVLGMSYYKQGKTRKACNAMSKAAMEIPSDLDCP